MNNKGFTLMELLAVIVIISILGIVAYSAVNGYINTTKLKAEEKFVDEISTEIESYLGLYGTTKFQVDNSEESVDFYKNVTGSTGYNSKAYKLKLVDNNYFTLQNLIADLKTTDKFINPNTEGVCEAGSVNIDVYRDSEYVYYYYVDMKNALGCSSSTVENIDTRPDNLKSKLCSEGSNAC